MENRNTIQATINYIKNELKDIYAARETESLAYILLEFVLKYSRTQIQLNKNEELAKQLLSQILAYTKELKTKKPIQYILGETEFYGLPFKVNEHTLIPRPETEELVDAIVKENCKAGLNILDIGTGSGCIPIALAKNLNNATIASADISCEAIEKAKENALLNKADITFLKRDILRWEECEWEQYDVIVSNPPYVTESEKEKMEANVLNHEPHTALFVSNHDPLLFYRNIAQLASKYLNPNGKLYFEINESLGKEMLELLGEKKFRDIRLQKDMNGKDRMISAIKPS